MVPDPVALTSALHIVIVLALAIVRVSTRVLSPVAARYKVHVVVRVLYYRAPIPV